MKKYDPRLPLISLHIAKAGGSSFKKILQKWYHIGYHSHYRNYHNMIDPPKHMGVRLHISRITPVCIHGHFDEDNGHGVFSYYPQAQQFITILRDPLETWISMYNYVLTVRKAKGLSEDYLSIDEFFEEKGLNILSLTPFNFNKDNYIDIIEENFIHIGVMENYQQSVSNIAQKLNKKPIKVPHLNISKFNNTPSKNTIEKFKEKYELEYLIYKYAKKSN